MSIAVAPNKIFKENQEIEFNDEKIVTLIGENGSGKSAILDKVFSDYIANEDTLLISFTSGQNESFTDIFSDHLKKSKRFLIDSFTQIIDDDGNIENNQASLNSFHFDSSWVRILIFFATTIKNDGLTRRFLLDKNIIDVSDGLDKDDLTTTIKFQIRILTRYLRKLEADDIIESRDSSRLPIRKSIIHQMLEKLMNHLEPWYDFSQKSNTKHKELKSKDAFRVLGKNVREIFTFLGYALRNNTIIINDSISLYFKEKLELNDLSDGEYQLLSVYALIDLFDGPETLFLFDEIDSHIHYLNTKKLWEALRLIEGKLLTTTHSADSILLHQPKNIRLVSAGKIEEELTAEHLFKRLLSLSENESYKYKVAAKFEYIALVEDKFDWFIFIELAKRKIADFNTAVEKIQVIKCSSGFSVINQEFADKRKKWVEDFVRINGINTITKAIFFICDRDNLPLANISQNNGVQVTGQQLPKFANNTKTPFLLSWKRLEIENYLLSHTLLLNHNLLENINQLLPGINPILNNQSNDNDNVRNLDVKSLLQPLYLKEGFATIGTNEEGVDYAKLKNLIAEIPRSEISEDIERMYQFILSKMTP
jgi:ABC-type multidrug transport system ATPase subunit